MEEDRAASNLGPDPSTYNELQETPVAPKQPKKRFVGRRTAAAQKQNGEQDPNASIEESSAIQVQLPRRSARALNNIPPEILDDKDINDAIALLPPNYNFEIHKTIHRIRTSGAKKIALQLPEGLLLFATTISDILTTFCPGISTLIMGDVTYGACCIDDYTARALGCDLLVHYAHSCLIPVAVTKITTLYVFVSITIDTQHLLDTINRNFQPGKTIAMVGTIQFNTTIHSIAPALRNDGYNVIIPQISPLSKGEILGCTSPAMKTTTKDRERNEMVTHHADLILYVGDGRFHLESAMIANPSLPAYRYDPYSRRLTHEQYSHDELHTLRSKAIHTARKTLQPPSKQETQHPPPRKWGIILGALGRQGNPHTLDLIQQRLKEQGVEWISILLSEIFPGKLAMMPDVGVWVQIACPRLSIDWGYAFPRPLLSPYEALVALGVREAGWLASEEGSERNVVEEEDGKSKADRVYPMDFYAKDGLGRTRKEDVVPADTAARSVGVVTAAG